MEAIYFDGQSSKPHSVKLIDQFDALEVLSSNPSESFNFLWPYEDITVESFASGQKTLLSYGEFPPQRIEINGDDADMYAKIVLRHASKIKKYEYKITKMNPFKLVITSFIVLAATISFYVFFIAPNVAEQAVKLIPRSVEAKVGEVMYNNMAFMIDVDTVKSKKLESFYQACGFSSNYDIHIDYADNDMVNAFAVPGGQIVVFKGLIKETQQWDELAALMGHELAHVNQRHSFKQIARGVSSYLIISVMTGDVAGASSVILDYAKQIHELANSRAHEREADMIGLEYLKELRIRPLAMRDLMQRLMDSHEASSSVTINSNLEYLSTHPLSANRINYIERTVEDDDSFDYESVNIELAKSIWQELKKDIEEEDDDDDEYDDSEEMQ